MHPFAPIFEAHPSLIRLYLISPDESTAFSASRLPDTDELCPVGNLNRLYHDSALILSGARRCTLYFGETLFTLAPLPQDWVLAVEHTGSASEAMMEALLDVAESMPEAAEDEPLMILTQDVMFSGPLGASLSQFQNAFKQTSDTDTSKTFSTALNSWIDLEDPREEGLHRFITILEEGIESIDKRRLFSDNVREILVREPKRDKRENMP